MKAGKILILFLFISIIGRAQTTYTAHPGTTELQTYLDLVLNPGDSIIVLSGVHVLTTQIYVDANGTEANPVVVIGEDGAIISHYNHASGDYVLRALTPTYLKFRNLIFDGWVNTVDSIPSNRCHLRLDGGNHVYIEKCEFRNNRRNAVNLYTNGTAGVRDVFIDSCNIHHALLFDGQLVDAHGIIGYDPVNIHVTNTNIWAVSGDCLQIDPGYNEIEWDSLFMINCNLSATILDTGWYNIPPGMDAGENGVDFKTPYTANLPSPTWKAYVYLKNVHAYGYVFDTIPLGSRNYNDRAAFLIKQAVNVTMDSCTASGSEFGFRLRGDSEWLGNPIPSAWVTMNNCFAYDNDIPLWFEQHDPDSIVIRNSVFELGNGNKMILNDGDTLNDPPRPAVWIELRSWEQDGPNDLSGVTIINSAFPDSIDSLYVGDDIFIDSLNMADLEVPDQTTYIDGEGNRQFVNPNTLPTAFSAVPSDFIHASLAYIIDTSTTVINIDFRGSSLTDNFNNIIYTATDEALFDSNNVATTTTVTITGFAAGSDTYGTGTSDCYFPDTTLRGGMNLPTLTDGYITFHNVNADVVDIHLMGLRSAIAGSYLDYTVNDSTQRGLTGNTLLPCSELVTYTNIPVVGDSVQIYVYSDYGLGGYLNAMDLVQYQIDSVEALSLSFSSTNVTCNGDDDGTATAIPAGGVEPYTYLWDIDSITAAITGLGPGWYVVTVTDALDSIIIDSVYISEPAILNQSGTITNDQDNAGTGSVVVSVSGGTTPYDFSWSNAEVTQSIYNLTADTYTLTITDNNGCISQDSYVVLNVNTVHPIVLDKNGLIIIGRNNKILINR